MRIECKCSAQLHARYIRGNRQLNINKCYMQFGKKQTFAACSEKNGKIILGNAISNISSKEILGFQKELSCNVFNYL